MLDSEKNLMNTSLIVEQRYSTEEALSKLKDAVTKRANRSSAGFRISFGDCPSSRLNPTLKYAPIYHVHTEGTYEWTETSYHNVGNALLGDVIMETEHTKSQSRNSGFVIDKSGNYCGFASPATCLSDKGNIFRKIENQQAMKLPLGYPLLTFKEMTSEISEQVKKDHKGAYSLSDLNITLVLVPIMEFTFHYDGADYTFFANLYSGAIDFFDVDISPVIRQTFDNLEKKTKYFKYAKIGALALFVLDVIISLVRGFGGKGDIGMFIFFDVIFGALLWLIVIKPWEKQTSTWETIDLTYPYDDVYITNEGGYTNKCRLFVAGHIAQIAACAFLLWILTGMAIWGS